MTQFPRLRRNVNRLFIVIALAIVIGYIIAVAK